MFDFQGFKDSLKRSMALAMAAKARAVGGYNRRRAVSAAASKRAARKRRNIAKH